MNELIRTWEWHPNSIGGETPENAFHAIAEAIIAANRLGMKSISVTTERTDHFMNGGNVVKGQCVTYTLRLGDDKPSA